MQRTITNAVILCHVL